MSKKQPKDSRSILVESDEGLKRHKIIERWQPTDTIWGKIVVFPLGLLVWLMILGAIVVNPAVQVLLSGMLIIIIVVFIIGIIYPNQEKTKKRKDQDNVTGIVRSLEDKSAVAPFAILLRPFVADNKTRFSAGWEDIESAKALGFKHFPFGAFDIDQAVVNLLSENMTLVRIEGKEIVSHGGSIKMADLEWKKMVTQLINSSQAIFVIPASSEGVLWEMRQIHSQHSLEKTIFVMPPEVGKDYGFKQDWDRIRLMYEWSRWQLPAYDADGAFFKLDGEGRLKVYIRALDRINGRTRFRLELED